MMIKEFNQLIQCKHMYMEWVKILDVKKKKENALK